MRTLFIGIGATKAGTTWLAHQLSGHPQVFMSPLKELHWFDAPGLKESMERQFAGRALREARRLKNGGKANRRGRALFLRMAMASDQDYLRYFRSLVRPNETVFGEVTPSYSLATAEGFARMDGLLPETRFIFLMRNPADRLWSQFRFRYKRRKLEPPNRLDLSVLTDPSTADMLARGDYERTLSRLGSVVPESRVFVAFYEDLFASTGADVMNRLWDFLGVEDKPTSRADFQHRMNVSPGSALVDEDRRVVVRSLERTYAWADGRYERMPISWRQDLDLL